MWGFIWNCYNPYQTYILYLCDFICYLMGCSTLSLTTKKWSSGPESAQQVLAMLAWGPEIAPPPDEQWKENGLWKAVFHKCVHACPTACVQSLSQIIMKFTDPLKGQSINILVVLQIEIYPVISSLPERFSNIYIYITLFQQGETGLSFCLL